jgi:hypothetical protein
MRKAEQIHRGQGGVQHGTAEHERFCKLVWSKRRLRAIANHVLLLPISFDAWCPPRVPPLSVDAGYGSSAHARALWPLNYEKLQYDAQWDLIHAEREYPLRAADQILPVAFLDLLIIFARHVESEWFDPSTSGHRLLTPHASAAAQIDPAARQQLGLSEQAIEVKHVLKWAVIAAELKAVRSAREPFDAVLRQLEVMRAALETDSKLKDLGLEGARVEPLLITGYDLTLHEASALSRKNIRWVHCQESASVPSIGHA